MVSASSPTTLILFVSAVRLDGLRNLVTRRGYQHVSCALSCTRQETCMHPSSSSYSTAARHLAEPVRHDSFLLCTALVSVLIPSFLLLRSVHCTVHCECHLIRPPPGVRF